MNRGSKPPSDSAGAAVNAALRLLAGREYSLFELRQKLAARFTGKAVDAALDKCVKEGWQSERRTAEMILRHVIFQGYGPKRLDYELSRRKITISISELEELPDWFEVAVAALRRKVAGKKDYSSLEKQKLLAWLYRRGFSSECCMKALTNVAESGH